MKQDNYEHYYLDMKPEISKKYFFNTIDKRQDKFTKAVSETIPRGYFIRVKKDVIVEEPIHAGLFMNTEKSSMSLHNIVVLEEGAHLHLVTGCTADRTINGGLHITVSEHYIGKNAKLINTMVHNWGPEFIVRSRSATVIQSGLLIGAAIGKIDIGELNYLQSKGLDEMQATALIIRGFLDVGIEIEGFSPELEKTIKEVSELSGHGEEKTSLY